MRHLHFAFDEFDGCKEKTCKSPAGCAAGNECAEGKTSALCGSEERSLEHILSDTIAEEKTACFDGCAEERCTDASVEARESLCAERLSEAVEGPSVA